MGSSDYVGPALRSVSASDDEAVRALFDEQRARLGVVRENRIWSWFGGMPSGFPGSDRVALGINLSIVSLCTFGVALIVAGFTRGPWLWGLLVVAIGCLVTAPLLTRSARRKTAALFANGVQVPGAVIGYEPEATDEEDEELRCVAVLLAHDVDDAGKLQHLLEVGERMLAFVRGKSNDAPSADLKPVIARVRERLQARDHDGSREAVPGSIGMKGCEIAFLRVNNWLLPDDYLSSRLLFVFVDPEQRGPHHARMLQDTLWGSADDLCDEFPLEEDE